MDLGIRHGRTSYNVEIFHDISTLLSVSQFSAIRQYHAIPISLVCTTYVCLRMVVIAIRKNTRNWIVSIHGGPLNHPIHCNKIFPYKPSILRYPHSWKTPWIVSPDKRGSKNLESDKRSTTRPGHRRASRSLVWHGKQNCGYLPVVKHGVLDNVPFRNLIFVLKPFKTSIQRGDFLAGRVWLPEGSWKIHHEHRYFFFHSLWIQPLPETVLGSRQIETSFWEGYFPLPRWRYLNIAR